MDNGACSYRRFLDGDDTGLSEIVKDYKDGLTLYLNGIVSNIFVAEELMEETFFRLITKKPRFNPDHSFKTWLYTIGRNVALDYLRRSSKLSDTPADELSSLIKEESDLEMSYIAEENKIALHRSLKKIAPDYRQAIWLVYFEGLTSAEASAVMRKSSRQMKNLLYRAKNALRTQLEKEGFTYEDL